MNTNGVRKWAGTLVATAIFVGAAGLAPAQPPVPGIRPGAMNPPALSPYLNLQRAGASAGVNYYGLVRPQMEFRNALQGLQQNFSGLAAQQTVDPQTGYPVTGHVATFLNTGTYFLSLSSGPGAQTGRPGAPRVGNQQAQQAPGAPPSSRGGAPNTPR
jgi:hypothetical protein